MEVVVKYNDQIRIINEPKNPKFRYMKKTIEIFDDHSCKYTHVYDNHVSTKNNKLSKKWQKYRDLFNIEEQVGTVAN